MQFQPVFTTRAAVFDVAHQREAPLRKLDPYLMRPPGMQADQHEAPAFAHLQTPDRQARGLFVRRALSGDDLFTATLS